jgi:hypothetical protein
MKRPENFENIDGEDFNIDGHDFYFDVDNLQNKKQSSWLWVFCNGQVLGDYAILLELKWEHDCYSMKKCVLGEGTTGDYIFQDNWISTKWIKTKDTFVEYISRLISSEIKVGTFQN